MPKKLRTLLCLSFRSNRSKQLKRLSSERAELSQEPLSAFQAASAFTSATPPAMNSPPCSRTEQDRATQRIHSSPEIICVPSSPGAPPGRARTGSSGSSGTHRLDRHPPSVKSSVRRARPRPRRTSHRETQPVAQGQVPSLDVTTPRLPSNPECSWRGRSFHFAPQPYSRGRPLTLNRC